jgi:RNA polymerase sigma-70 factor (ECF subfamily)
MTTPIAARRGNRRADASPEEEEDLAPATTKASLPEFREIFETNIRFVWRSLGRLGVRDSDVLDQAQKVFLTAYSKLAEFEGRSQISTWLFAICYRVAGDYRRTALFRREIPTETSQFDLYPNAQEDLEEGAESRQRAREAESILNKLPKAQRLVFVLFELEDMNGQDIANLLGISVGTVRSRLRLARAAFSREVERLSVQRARKHAV